MRIEEPIQFHVVNTRPAVSTAEKYLMSKQTIAVTPTNPEKRLHYMSRVSFGKVYSVQ